MKQLCYHGNCFWCLPLPHKPSADRRAITTSHPLNHNFITVPLQFSVFQSLISDGGHESCDRLYSEETLINVLELVCNPNTERVLQLQQEEQFDASKFTFKSFMTRLFSCSLVLYFSVNYFDFFNSFLYHFIYLCENFS